MPRVFQSREELAQHLSSDEGFLKLPQADRDAIFQQGMTQVKSGMELGQAETIGAPTPLNAHDVLPNSLGPIKPRIPGSALGMDVLHNVGALYSGAVDTARNMVTGRAATNPLENYTTALRGGIQYPTKEDQFMSNTVPATLLGMMPLNIPGMGQAVNRMGQSVSTAVSEMRIPSILPRRIETVQDVLAVPEARLPKLTKSERADYFKFRGQQIKAQFAVREAQLKLERVAIQKELGKVATKRSLELRPQVPAFMKRQSQHYRDLADAELAPLANEVVSRKELADFVRNRYRYPDQLEDLNEVSARLQLGNESLTKTMVSPLVDDLGRPITQTIPETHKLGELYETMKDFGQEFPRAIRDQAQSFGQVEHFTNEAIETLFDYLKTKGIDLSKANTFWAEWKPVQKQIMREVRPFDISGTQTAKFSKRLRLSAMGMDPDNKNYIDILAKGIGIDDLPGPIKPLVQKLSSTEKEIVAMKLMNKAAQTDLQALQFRIKQLAPRDPQRGFAILNFIKRWIVPSPYGPRF